MTGQTSERASTTRSFPTSNASRGLQPVAIAFLVALLSYLGLLGVVRGVFTSIPAAPLVAVFVAAALLVVALAAVFRVFQGRPRVLVAIVIALGVLAMYSALAVTGTQRASVASLRPELVIVIVSLITGAATSVTAPGRWRLLGVAGLVGVAALLLTPLYVSL